MPFATQKHGETAFLQDQGDSADIRGFSRILTSVTDFNRRFDIFEQIITKDIKDASHFSVRELV